MTRFKIGIRTKLVFAMALVGLLPLLLLLMASLDRVQNLRKEIAGQGILAVSQAESRGLGISLAKDIQGLEITLNEVDITSIIAGQSTKLSDAEIKRLDSIWHDIPSDAEPISSTLNNPISKKLRALVKADPRFAEIFITDRFGQLYTSTDRTDDFYQADEEWWRKAFNDDKGKVYIPPVDFDPAMRVFTINLCIPIFHEQTIVGIAKIKVDLNRWMADVEGSVAGAMAHPMLITSNGEVVYRAGLQPLTSKLPEWTGTITQWGAQGWRQTDSEFQGFCPIKLDKELGGLPTEMPPMILVMYVPTSEITGPLNHMVMLAGLAGLGLIVVFFLTGLLVMDRVVTRRVSRMVEATRRIAAGDFTERLGRKAESSLGKDEIDQLAGDFDEMISRIQRSHNELQAANELKTNFIHIASHELRTPISYILGVAKLLKDCKDPERLMFAIQSVSARAKRLDDIVHAMFKLMPGQTHEEKLFYQDVILPEMLEEIYLDCFPFIEQRNQKLMIQAADDMPPIKTDRDKLRDILENLLANAIKFTPNGGTVHVTAARQLHDSLSISVIDEGTGIPENELPHIFQPFYSGSDVFQHSTGEVGYQKRGMGLGLAIVRHFTELLGGTVNVSTGPGGSTFTVTIPMAPPNPAT